MVDLNRGGKVSLATESMRADRASYEPSSPADKGFEGHQNLHKRTSDTHLDRHYSHGVVPVASTSTPSSSTAQASSAESTGTDDQEGKGELLSGCNHADPMEGRCIVGSATCAEDQCIEKQSEAFAGGLRLCATKSEGGYIYIEFPEGDPADPMNWSRGE